MQVFTTFFTTVKLKQIRRTLVRSTPFCFEVDHSFFVFLANNLQLQVGRVRTPNHAARASTVGNDGTIFTQCRLSRFPRFEDMIKIALGEVIKTNG